jgi:hypothetical protein
VLIVPPGEPHRALGTQRPAFWRLVIRGARSVAMMARSPMTCFNFRKDIPKNNVPTRKVGTFRWGSKSVRFPRQSCLEHLRLIFEHRSPIVSHDGV